MLKEQPKKAIILLMGVLEKGTRDKQRYYKKKDNFLELKTR